MKGRRDGHDDDRGGQASRRQIDRLGKAQRSRDAESLHPGLPGAGEGQTFKGKVTLSDIDAPNGYTISGEGEGGIAGFAKGGAKVHLQDADGGGTMLIYNVEANVGGKIAQLGSRLIDGVAKKLSDAFFTNFVKAVGGAASG
jgi:carbon monoxide dehydrogenase subunit G